MTPRRALLAIHLGALMFGLSGVLGRLAESEPVFITFARALFAVAALWLAGRWLPLSGACPNWRQRGQLLFGGALLGAHWVTFFIAVKTAGVGIATLGFASFPAFTLLLEGLLFRERTRPAEYLTVALVGLGLLLVTPEFDPTAQVTLGLLYGVGSGLLFALLSLLNRATVTGVDPVRVALWQNLAIVLILLPWGLPRIPAVPASDWLWLALLGILCTGLAHSLFVASLRVLKARTASVIFALEPVYGILFAWLLFTERPSAGMLAGGSLIILASIVASRLKSPPAAPGAGTAPA